MPYNIAFVSKNIKSFVDFISHHKHLAHTYCLNEKSIPHITICQFETDQELLDNIFDNLYHEQIDYNLLLNFNIYSDISFDNGNLNWLSLIPDKTDKLIEIFNTVSKYVKNLRKDKYDPHLTLFNYMGKDYSIKDFGLPESPNFSSQEFYLILGRSDEVGQLLEILQYFNNPASCRFLK